MTMRRAVSRLVALCLAATAGAALAQQQPAQAQQAAPQPGSAEDIAQRIISVPNPRGFAVIGAQGQIRDDAGVQGGHALRIPVPVLQATRFGTPLRFAAPAVEVRAQPLPAWLPEDVPVGALAMEPAADGAQAVVGRPWPLRFVVTGEIAPRVLQDLLQAQLPHGGPWSAYPPEIRPLPDGGPASRQEVTLYARPAQAGVLATPALRLGWFDPGSGRIEQAQLPSRRIAVAHAPLAAGWRWAAASAMVLLIALLAWAVWRRCRWRLARRRLQRALRAPLDAERLHALVLGFDNVLRALESRRPPKVLIEAFDGAPDGKRKLYAAAHRLELDCVVIETLTSAELGLALGRENVIHAAVQPGGLAERLIFDAERLSGFREAGFRAGHESPRADAQKRKPASGREQNESPRADASKNESKP